MDRLLHAIVVVLCCLMWLTLLQADCVYENNNITRIPFGSMPPGLTDINFQGNPIETIDDDAFDVLNNTLTNLVFESSSFTKIPNAFSKLKVITYLKISNNNITDWNEDVMRMLGETLQAIELDNVGLKTWPTWVQNYSSLNEIIIVGNSFASIPDNALDNVVDTLESFSLNNNRLTMVPKAFSKLKHLESLYLQYNRISDVSCLPQLSTGLATLSLSYNRISNAAQLAQAMQPYAKSLATFDINYNQLTSIPNLLNLTQIFALDYSFNSISDAYSGSAHPTLFDINFAHNSLKTVPRILSNLFHVMNARLAWNSIQTIQASDFHWQTSLIDLGYNLITELTDTSFPMNSSINYLQLNNNPLSRIYDAALKNLPNLLELSLQSTKITRLPLGLRYLSKLGLFDVSNNVGLVCTCLEKDLTPWIKNVTTSGKVIGDCGHISVFNFFTQLSPACP